MVESNIIDRLRRSRFLSFFVPTLERDLDRALRDCQSVLDLGCGPKSPVRFLTGIERRVGVDGFAPYLEVAKNNSTHTEYRLAMLDEIDFLPKEFDGVVMVDVLEHLPRELGESLLKKAETWASKVIVISSPNGFIEQQALDGNELQRHLSGWDVKDMRSRGFVVRGMAGPKFIRQEVQDDTMGDDLLTSIRLRPKVVWFAIATLLQPVVYRLPQFSFSLFSVRKISD